MLLHYKELKYVDKVRKWPCLAFKKATNDDAKRDNFTCSMIQILVIKLIISTFVASLHGTL
jgi:hypothetical protein